MPMKFSLTLGQRRPLDRQTARGCLTANLLGLPGLGSLAAGRKAGYAQMALSFAGLALTSVYGVRFLIWFSSTSTGSQQLDNQTGEYFEQVWLHVRSAFLGMGIFLCGWLWGLASGLSILSEAHATDKPTIRPIPPKL